MRPAMTRRAAKSPGRRRRWQPTAAAASSAQYDFGLRGGTAFHDETIDAAYEGCRVIQFAALCQHCLVVEHMRQIGEAGLIGRILEALNQGMLRIQFENRRRGKRILLACLLENAAHAQAHAELS